MGLGKSHSLIILRLCWLLKQDYMKEFLFAELDKMGTMTFLDYFPQFRDPNGAIIQKQRSSKAYSTRPWDDNGNLILNPST